MNLVHATLLLSTTCVRCCTHELAVHGRRQSGLIEEASTASERTTARLEREHRDALRGQMLSEERLTEELLRWRHDHPDVSVVY